MTSAEFSNAYRILLRVDYLDGLEYESVADEDGVWLYDFYPDGYPYLSAYVANKRFYDKGIAIKLAKRVAFVVSYINPDIEYDVLMRYMDILCMERFDTEGWIIDRNEIRGIIESNQVLKDYKTIDMPRARFVFRKGLTKSEKASIINKNRKLSKVTETVLLVQNAIDYIKQDGSIFITSSVIRNMLGDRLSKSGIKRYVSLFSEDICRYNEQVFGTKSFLKYVKMCNINSVIDAINEIVELKESLSRRNVSKRSNVHFNTVQRLWIDEAIQGTLNKLNHLITA